MRQRARIDRNQPEIIRALRQIGASVEPIHTLGKGKPDLLVGYRGVNLLLEIKDGEKAPSRRQLTPDELDFKDSWRGHCVTVISKEEAVNHVLLMTRKDYAASGLARNVRVAVERHK